jgi:RNA polymerase sigma-70 factor (ECF subfamily)
MSLRLVFRQAAPYRSNARPVSSLDSDSTGTPPWSDDVEAIAQLRDRDAFMRIYDHFAPRLQRYLAGLSGCEGRAEELTQEALLKLWHKAEQFDPAKASLATWLYRIARNLYIDHVRQDRGWLPAQDSLAALERLEAPDDGSLDFSSRQEQKLATALQALPPDQARVIRMAYFEAMSHRQIADQLQLPLGTVKSSLRLAFRKLRAGVEAPP